MQQLIMSCEAVETELPNGHYRIEVRAYEFFGSKLLATFERHSKEAAMRDLCGAGYIWVEHIEDLNDLRQEGDEDDNG